MVHMVQDLSRGSWGEGGSWGWGPAAWSRALGRTMGLGRRAGGLSCTPMRGATTGLKLLTASPAEVELALRRMLASALAAERSMTLWMGLSDSLELPGVLPPPPPGLCRCISRVSSTTSGACLAELCLSSSRSSFRAVFIVSSMSCSGMTEDDGETHTHARTHRDTHTERREKY